jgi:serine/threonine-protein kinase
MITLEFFFKFQIIDVSKINKKWIWPFELLEKIGEGGMGVVYRARYVKNDKQVAVKILPEEVTDEIVLGRFDRELEILRKLRHPNIVHSFGGTTEGSHRFYAMEIVEGGSFDKLLEHRGALPWELAVKYFQQITAALQYAHSHDVTHRDVKPGNFLISSNGQLKLSDFGLATFAAAQNLTAAGKTMGTFRYMSPEQIRGKNIGARADLYSLGCVMYEVLTGEPPFDGTSAAEILDQHLNKKAPRVSLTVFDCPAELDLLISSLLEKSPEKRPASAEQIQQRLETVSPVKMVSVNQTEATRDVQTTPAMETRKERLTDFTIWKTPNWVIATLIAVPLLLIGWSLQLQQKSYAADVALESWKVAWNSPDEKIQREAAIALGKIGRVRSEVLDVLTKDLNSTDPAQLEMVLVGLEAAGGYAVEHKKDVYDLLQNSPEPEVRYQAKQTIDAFEENVSSRSTIMQFMLLTLLGVALFAVYIIAGKKFAN